jgi:hypothetical protein
VAEPADKAEILSSGKVLIDRGVLTGHADQRTDRPRVGGHVVTEHRGPSRVRFEDGAEDADSGRLAGAVGSEQTQYAAPGDSQVDAVQRRYGTEALGQPLSPDHLAGPVAARPCRHASRPALAPEAAGGTAT